MMCKEAWQAGQGKWKVSAASAGNMCFAYVSWTGTGERRIQMRQIGRKSGKLERVICNMCGNEVKHIDNVCFSADMTFGYFSRKDGIRHHFDLCEDCYDRVIAGFRIPVEEWEETELV